MALVIATAPTIEPVSLEDAKLHLRVDHTADDELILGLIATARRDVETMTQHALITQTWDLFLDGFPAGRSIKLPMPPLQSVTGVYYTAEGQIEATYASSNYYVDTRRKPGRIILVSTASWPTISTPQAANAVRVRFVCGFGNNISDVDERAVLATKLLIGHYYENREAVFMGRTSPVLLPMGVTALCMDLRASVLKF